MRERRLAWRVGGPQLRRDRRRTLILILVLAVPLTMAVSLSTVNATSIFSPEDRVEVMDGQSRSILLNAQLLASEGPVATLRSGPELLREAVGREVPIFAEVSGPMSASAGGRQVDATGIGLELDEPIHRGRFELIGGEPATTSREVALSRAVAERLDVEIGDEVELGPQLTDIEVSGILLLATDTERAFAVATPETVIAGSAPLVEGEGARSERLDREAVNVFWHSPEAIDATQALDEQGWRVESRKESLALLRREADVVRDEIQPLVAGGAVLVMAELGLVIAAAYTIVVARSRRDLALLACTGASYGLRRSVVTYQGVLTGLLGTVVAVVVGLGAAALLVPVFAARADESWSALRVDPASLALVIVLGMATPGLAARFAARSVRRDLVAALGGHPGANVDRDRKTPTAAAGVTVGGVILVLGGAELPAPSLVVLGGLGLVIAAGMLVRPRLRALARRGDQLPLVSRLGFRVTTRAASRAASLSTVVASLTVMVGLVLVGLGGFTVQAEREYVPDSPEGSILIDATRSPQPATIAAMTRVLGASTTVEFGEAVPPAPSEASPAGDPYTYWGRYEIGSRTPLTVIDDGDLETVLGRAPSPDEREAMADGHALVLHEEMVDGVVVTARAPDPEGINDTEQGTLEVELPATIAADVDAYPGLPDAYVTDAGLEALGGISQPNEASFYVPTPDTPITTVREDQARRVLGDDIGAGFFVLDVERGSEAADEMRAVTAAVFALLVVVASTLAFVTVVLATEELRPDLSALAAAGTHRRLRSALSGSHAAQVTLIGLGIGGLVTLVTTPALLASLEVPWSLAPWVGLFLAALGALAAAVIAGRIAGSRVTTLIGRAR